MDFVLIGFVTFKVVAFCTAMFFAIKWHYDQGEKRETRAVLRAGAKMAAVFVLAALGLGFFTFTLTSMLGLDLGY